MNSPYVFPAVKSFTATDGMYIIKDVCAIDVPASLQSVFETACELFPQINTLSAKDSDIVLCRSDGYSAEGYSLTVRKDEIRLEFSDDAGAFYALITLFQLMSQGGKIQCSRIDDAPGLKLRGVMIDISRGKVPTVSTLKFLIDRLSLFKINHLQLYIEGVSFAYPSHKELWAEENPITPDELRELDGYCARHFIDFVPCQNGMGHMARWLACEKYRCLAECEEGFTVKGFTFPPTTVDPTDERSLRFVCSLFDELLPCFNSRLCNVCLDEPFELCMGKNSQRKTEKIKIYTDYANRLNSYIKSGGRQMMMWGDVVAVDGRAPDYLDSDIMILDWGYEQEHPAAKRAERLSRSGHPFCMCPGTNSWTSFTGMTENMLTCIKNTSDAAYKYGAKGMIVTDWGDMGHLQYLPVSWPGILAAAAYSWNENGTDEAKLADALDRFVFKDSAGVMGKICLDAGRYCEYEEFRIPCRTLASTVLSSGLVSHAEYEKKLEFTAKSILFFIKEDFAKIYIDSYENRKPFDGTAVREYISEIYGRLSKAQLNCDDAETVLREYKTALITVDALVKIREIMLSGAKFPELSEQLSSIIQEHRCLWNIRNKPYGCEDGLAPLIKIRERLSE